MKDFCKPLPERLSWSSQVAALTTTKHFDIYKGSKRRISLKMDGGEILTTGKSQVSGCDQTMILRKAQGVKQGGGDWILENYDEKRSVPQSLDEELLRLQVLRSYLILDGEREFPFERLTALASRIHNAPIALVSLIDVGRQWFMSNRGLGNLRETPRKHAFCAHAIISKDDLLIVTDAAKDPRFANNPLVTGPPYIRFYAGAPLLAPEGYKLGTFCVIDTKPRPEGLDLDSKQNLRELSALAVQVLVSRRRKRERECEKNSQPIACTAHDLLTPLSGIELSLALLKNDEEFQSKLTTSQKEGIEMAITCSNVLQDICRKVRNTFGEEKSAFELSFVRAQLHAVTIDEMVERLYLIIDPIEKEVPVKITVEDDVPKEIVSDYAKIFRCAMNYLAVACARTREGSVSMRLFVKKDSSNDKPLLYVTCEDTAPAIDLDAYAYLFKPVTKQLDLLEGSSSTNKNGAGGSGDRVASLELALFSVACEMNSIGGEYGFRPCNTDKNGFGSESTGSVFWFSIPFTEPTPKESLKEAPKSQEASLAKTSISPVQASTISPAQASKFQEAVSSAADDSKEVAIADTHGVQRCKRALIIEDSAVVLRMMSTILTKLGFDVTQADNGRDGLKELKESLFDLTLCDFLMPSMDGLDCVQQYREWEQAHRPWLSQRILGISAHASEADVKKGLQLGMNEYMPKPVTFKQLSELIATDDQIAMSKRLDQIEGDPEMTVGNYNVAGVITVRD
jgi:CheY-like chemotaxis protein